MSTLRCRYRRTERNGLALQLMSDLGFVLHATSPGEGFLERDLSPVAGADVVNVVTKALP
jgi:hypothetical protein